MTVSEFRAAIEVFIAKHSFTPTDFGKMFANDPSFVFDLRDGREPREKTREAVLSRMKKASKAGLQEAANAA